MIGQFFTEYFKNHDQKTESKTENQTIYGQIDPKSEPKLREQRPIISISSALIRLFSVLSQMLYSDFHFRPKTIE